MLKFNYYQSKTVFKTNAKRYTDSLRVEREKLLSHLLSQIQISSREIEHDDALFYYNRFEQIAQRDVTLNKLFSNASKALVDADFYHAHGGDEHHRVTFFDAELNSYHHVYFNIYKDDDVLKFKRLKRQQQRLQHELAVAHGLIQRDFYSRAMPNNMREKQKKDIAQAKWLSEAVAFNTATGEQVSLKDSQIKKISEFRAVMRGLREFGDENGLVCYKAVVKLPSEFHANPTTKWGAWDGTLPCDSRSILRERWAQLQAYLAKSKIVVSGFWSLETHQDGTPHLNFFFYADPTSYQDVEDAFINYFDLSPHLPNVQNRVLISRIKKNVTVSNEKGEQVECNFEHYATKIFTNYITKNIDADAQIKDINTLDEREFMSLAERTSASAMGWRRYGFFGLPSLTSWRRLRAHARNGAKPKGLLRALQNAAQSSDFKKFIELNHGLCIQAKNRPIKTIYELSNTGKSRISTGVLLKSNNYTYMSKFVGTWTLTKASHSNFDEKVRVNLTNASECKKLTSHYFSAQLVEGDSQIIYDA